MSVRGTSIVVAAMLLVGAGQARAQSEYISEAVGRAVTQAGSAGDYSGYGMTTSSFCLLGGWITQGNMLQYSMNLSGGTSYLFVGAGDRDVRDLDISVTDGTNTVEDTETDNTPFVHVEAQSDTEVTITVTNYQGSGQPDFCCLIILESDGGQANIAGLNQAAQGLVTLINSATGYATDQAADASSWCILGGLFGQGGELGMTRTFTRGNYMLVGWGDTRAKDLDAFVQGPNGEEVAADTETDSTPVVTFNVQAKGNLRGTLNLRMYQSKGNAFGVCAVLRQQ